MHKHMFLVLVLLVMACRTPRAHEQGESGLASNRGTSAPRCGGQFIRMCELVGEHDLATTIEETLKTVQTPASGTPLPAHRVACGAVRYPGAEAQLQGPKAGIATLVCLFDSQYSMNMALNRISTFVEDFTTVDAEPGYSDAAWAQKQQSEGTKGHNLESPDLARYAAETASYIRHRARSTDPGIALEAEFHAAFVEPMLHPHSGKSRFIVLGVYVPPPAETDDPAGLLKAVLGHEIFHALYFHSEKMRTLVKNYVDAQSPYEQTLMRRRLVQKGYAVSNADGAPPSAKQQYMFYNETQAYLLESGACADGAFISYQDEDKDEPQQPLKGQAPLVLRHAAPLRRLLLEAKVIDADWTKEWSPSSISCRP